MGLKARRQKLAPPSRVKLKLPPKPTDPFYGSEAHKQWRSAVIARAKRRCQWPGCGVTEPRMYADHIVERRDGGDPTSLANGQCLCARHHSIKTFQHRAQRR